MSCNVIVLISGTGSNLQALMDASAPGAPYSIRAVISNQPDAYGLDRARAAGIEALVIDHREFTDRANFDRALMAAIDERGADLVALAGFMRILTDRFVHHYRGRLLNIHPSLLPRFRGLTTHQKALESGDSHHGASVHFVTEELDGGPVIVQARLKLNLEEDAKQLAARVLRREHIIYPLAVRWFAEGRLGVNDHQVLLDGQPLAGPVVFDLD
jgi:phosphoribosylglycinamide formyltransferase 1